MTEDTKRRLAQEIRHRRALLTAEETWWQQQPMSAARTEGFRAINFWRNVLRDAEHRLGVGDLGESESEQHRPLLAT
jgi:acyl-CoA reductase-like NAD-dependent aldehyde dehydrogenase